mmetsp:Transcript_53680/g.166200  ORF Transcript_53680/g.166200 Transcript_53680/m.166200 type:complete len:202 (-) Transcript_53680:105-710(-)
MPLTAFAALRRSARHHSLLSSSLSLLLAPFTPGSSNFGEEWSTARASRGKPRNRTSRQPMATRICTGPTLPASSACTASPVFSRRTATATNGPAASPSMHHVASCTISPGRLASGKSLSTSARLHVTQAPTKQPERNWERQRRNWSVVLLSDCAPTLWNTSQSSTPVSSRPATSSSNAAGTKEEPLSLRQALEDSCRVARM